MKILSQVHLKPCSRHSHIKIHVEYLELNDLNKNYQCHKFAVKLRLIGQGCYLPLNIPRCTLLTKQVADMHCRIRF